MGLQLMVLTPCRLEWWLLWTFIPMQNWLSFRCNKSCQINWLFYFPLTCTFPCLPWLWILHSIHKYLLLALSKTRSKPFCKYLWRPIEGIQIKNGPSPLELLLYSLLYIKINKSINRKTSVSNKSIFFFIDHLQLWWRGKIWFSCI
jgi:hypothetical protein